VRVAVLLSGMCARTQFLMWRCNALFCLLCRCAVVSIHLAAACHTRHMELVLEQVKLRHDEEAMAAVQEGTRHVIRLCLRQMSMQHRAVLDRIISQRKHVAEDPNTLRFVITQLFTRQASHYVQSVLRSVITGALPPGHNNPHQAPPPPVGDQLVCLNLLASESAPM